MSYLLALDQGTSSSRSIVFDEDGHIISEAQREITQIYPQPGWVEHNPTEIWDTQLATAREALAKAGISSRDLSALGITNQRETTVVWDKQSGKPIYNAIVWQDRRNEASCVRLREQGWAEPIRAKTGLLLDAYFSATKLQWILSQVPDAMAQAERGELLFGTVDSWLIWKLSGGTAHVTDVSNASRTMLFDIHLNAWDSDLLAALNIPPQVLPRVLPSSAHFADLDPQWLGSAVPICGVAGDQQSALFGQACFKSGMVKNTYGTGCFMLLHSGGHCMRSENGLISTSAARVTAENQFAIEGSVFVGGAVVQWLRDGLGLIRHSSEVQALAESVPDSGGVMVVPAFTGLGAPYWHADVRGSITGLTRGTTAAHIARAALESIAFQSAALLLAMSRDLVQSGAQPVRELRVDGGACVNDLLMQFQADLLGLEVLRPAVVETTALGAAYLAGLACGVYRSTDELSQLWRVERRFTPQRSESYAADMMLQWEHAVRKTLAA